MSTRTLEEAERRDVKGLYGKARRGELINFTGIDSPYEPPEAPEIRIDTVAASVEGAADRVIARLRELGLTPMNTRGVESTPLSAGEASWTA